MCQHFGHDLFYLSWWSVCNLLTVFSVRETDHIKVSLLLHLDLHLSSRFQIFSLPLVSETSFTPGSLRLHSIQSSLFAPFLTNGAEVSWITWRAVARNFRAIPKSRLSPRKGATRLAAGYVTLAPVLATATGEETEGCKVNERWSPVDREVKKQQPRS